MLVVLVGQEAEEVAVLVAGLGRGRRHQVVEVGGRGGHALAPHPQGVHVRQLQLRGEQGLHVEVVDVGQRVVWLHHHLKETYKIGFV